jgi:hypothetical protein
VDEALAVPVEDVDWFAAVMLLLVPLMRRSLFLSEMHVQVMPLKKNDGSDTSNDSPFLTKLRA